MAVAATENKATFDSSADAPIAVVTVESNHVDTVYAGNPNIWVYRLWLSPCSSSAILLGQYVVSGCLGGGTFFYDFLSWTAVWRRASRLYVVLVASRFTVVLAWSTSN